MVEITGFYIEDGGGVLLNFGKILSSKLCQTREARILQIAKIIITNYYIQIININYYKL